MFKYTIPAILQVIMPSYTWKVNTKDKLLYLTFDDGPHPEITPWVLDQLESYHAKATFFCVGDNVRKYPEIFSKILLAGHAVGNHTYHHLKGWDISDEEYLADVALGSEWIPGTLFRPPYGRIKRSQTRILKNKYRIVMWDRLSCDYQADLNIAESMHYMKKVDKGNILVFHDSEKAYRNLEKLLPPLLKYYSEQGYQMQSIPEIEL